MCLFLYCKDRKKFRINNYKEKRCNFAKGKNKHSTKIKSMQIVTLTTDWGEKDFYAGLVKSRLFKDIPDVNIVDITHGIKKFDILPAAFVVKNACLNFPENTIHIIDINTFESKDYAFIVVKANNQFYICTDNGLPSLIFEDMDVEIYNTKHIYSDGDFYTFAVWDNFCKITKILANTHSLETIGEKQEEFAIKSTSSLAYISGNIIRCTIVYIDDYGNAYLNIDDKEFERVLGGKQFELPIGNHYIINKLALSYQDVNSKGDALLTISVTGNLELALREGNFAKLLGYKVGDHIDIFIK